MSNQNNNYAKSPAPTHKEEKLITLPPLPPLPTYTFTPLLDDSEDDNDKINAAADAEAEEEESLVSSSSSSLSLLDKIQIDAIKNLRIKYDPHGHEQLTSKSLPRFSRVKKLYRRIYNAYDNHLKKNVILKFFNYNYQNEYFEGNEHEVRIFKLLNKSKAKYSQPKNQLHHDLDQDQKYELERERGHEQKQDLATRRPKPIVELYDWIITDINLKIDFKLAISSSSSSSFYSDSNSNHSTEPEYDLLTIKNLATDQEFYPPFYSRSQYVRTQYLQKSSFLLVMEKLGPDLFTCIQNPRLNHIYLQFNQSMIENSSLFSVSLSQLSQYNQMLRLQKLMAGIFRTVKHCHDESIAHCDIKLENLVFRLKENRTDNNNNDDDDEIDLILIDYEMAAELEPQSSKSSSSSSSSKFFDRVCGTTGYIAPELLFQKLISESNSLVSTNNIINCNDENENENGSIIEEEKSHLNLLKCDIWSLGITILALIGSENFMNRSPVMNPQDAPDSQMSNVEREFRNILKTFGSPILLPTFPSNDNLSSHLQKLEFDNHKEEKKEIKEIDDNQNYLDLQLNWPQFFDSALHREYCQEEQGWASIESIIEKKFKVENSSLSLASSTTASVIANQSQYCKHESKIKNLKKMLSKMLCYNPNVRPSIDDLLTDPFFFN